MKVKSWGNAVHSHRKRALALFLSFVMVFNTIPTNAVAEDTLSAGNDAAIVQDDSAPANEQPTQQTEELQNSGGREQTTAPEAQESQEGEGADDEGDPAGADVEDIEPAPAQDDQAVAEASLPAFDQEATVGTMRVRVQLPEGAFPADAKLEVNATSDEESQSIASAVEVVRNKDREVVASRALKIVVRGNDGNPLQPANGAKARVSFGLGDYKDDQFTAEVFSISGSEKLEAKSLAVTKDGDFAIVADTDATTFDVLFTRARKATPTFPAFSQQAKLDGVTIKVSAGEGVFPEGAKLDVKKVSVAAQKKASDAVDEARDSSKEVATSYTFDIKVLNKNGAEVQPADDAKVNVSFATAEVAKQELTTEVFHIDDETGKAESLAVKESGTTAKVVVDGFSIYVITFAADGTTVASPAFATYKFYNNENDPEENPVRSQKVKQGDDLYEPSTPEPPEGQKFVGWYVGNEKLNFTSEGKLNLATLHVSTNGVVRVNAHYDTYHYVTFYDQGNNVFTRMSVVDGGSIAENALPTFTPNLSTQTLVGWSETKNGTTAVTFPLQNIKADAQYYPIIQQSYVLTFDANRLPRMQEDASTGTKQLTVSYTPPQTVAPGATTTEPADPTCESSAYTFDGWYTDSACTTEFTFGQPLGKDTTVYAKWTEGKAKYKVVVWKEKISVFYGDASRNKLTPSNYDYYKSEDRYAVPLSTVSLEQNDSFAFGFTDEKDKGFEVASYGKPAAKKVMPDGSTVFNVYWNRQTVESEFYHPSPTTGYLTKKDSSGQVVYYYYTDYWQHAYTIHGLYGQSFAMYKSTGDSDYENYKWPDRLTGDTRQYYTYNGNTYDYQGLYNRTALRAYFNDSLSPKYYIDPVAPIANSKVYYVLQKADGTWPTENEARVPTTSNGTVLAVNFDTSVGGAAVNRSTFENFKGVSYSLNDYSRETNGRTDIPASNSITFSPNTQSVYLYFERDSFPVEFYNKDSSQNNSYSSSRRYESSLADCANYKLDDTATERFVGWATDPGQSDVLQAVDFSKLTVPDYTLRFYPIYATDQVNVKLKLAGDDAAASEVTLPEQQSKSFWPNVNDTIDMTLMNQAKRDGYELEGWYTQDGTKWTDGTQLDPKLCAKDANGNPILNEPAAGYSSAYYTITLTARWHAAAQAPVVYKGDGTSGISDNDIYTLNGDVKVSPSLPSSGNKTFIGWRDLNGNMHQPGDTFTFDSKVLLNSEGKLELTAVYTAENNPKTKVTYHANYSGSSATSDSDELEWNGQLVLPDNTFTRDGYRITGWSTIDGATTPDSGFEPGKTVGVSAMGATIDASTNTATIDLYAVWEDAATLTFAPNNEAYGSVDKTSILVGKYTTDSVTVVATPADGYHLVNWTKDGAEVGTDTKLTLTKPDDGWTNASYVAVFHKHDWSWAADGNKVVATCGNTDGAHKGDTTVTLTLNVEDVTYLTPVSASVDNKSGMEETGTTVGEITFEGRGNTAYASSTKAPELAGTYTAKVTVTENGHPYTATKDFTIKPKEPSATEQLTFDLANDPQTYDGNAHTPKVTNVKLGGIELVEGRGYRVEYANNVNAGTATAKVILMGNFSGEKAKTFQIAKANISPTVDVANKAYDGNPVVPTISNNPGNGSVTYTYEKRSADGNNWSTYSGTPTDAGTYRATATIAETDNYKGATTNTKEFTISKANPVVTAPTVEELTYTGQPQDLVNAGRTTGGTMLYSLNGTDWQDTVPTATNAGTYTVHYKVEGNNNYNSVEPKTVSVTIGAKTLAADDYTMTLDKNEFTYNKGEQKPAVTITLKGGTTKLTEGTDFDVKYFDKDGKEIVAADSKNAAHYSVKVVFKGNYAGESEPKSYTIEPKPLTASDVTFDGSSFTYNGTPQGPTITVTDGETTLAPMLNYNVVNDKNTNVGTYTVTVTGKGNYTGTVEHQYTIGKDGLNPETLTGNQKPTATEGLVYNGADQALVDAPTNVPAGYTMQYSLNGTDWSDELPTGKDAGTYNVHVRYKGDDNHRDLTLPDPISVPIARKPVTITPQAGQTKVYGTSDPATYTYSQDGVVSGDTLNGKLKRATGEDVGAYAFSIDEFTATGANPNYDVKLADSAPQFSITKADQDAPAKPALSADPHSVTVTNPIEGVEYTLVDSTGTAVAGINSITATKAQDGTISVTFANLTPNVTYAVKAKVPGDGNHEDSPEVKSNDITTPKEDRDAPTTPQLDHGASSVTATDGIIKDVDGTMEYSTDGGATWNNVTGNTITNLPAGETLVRYKETDTKDPSPAKKVDVTFTLNGTITWNYVYDYVDEQGHLNEGAIVNDNENERSKHALIQLLNAAGEVIDDRETYADAIQSADGRTATATYVFGGLSTLDGSGNTASYSVNVIPLVMHDNQLVEAGSYSVNFDDTHTNASVRYNQECFDATWTVHIAKADGTEGAVPDTVYVKVFYGVDTDGNPPDNVGDVADYVVITQQATGNGVACTLAKDGTGYKATGQFPVWKYRSGGGTYYHKAVVTGYKIDGKFYSVLDKGYTSDNPMYYNGDTGKASDDMVVTIEDLKVPMVEFDPNGGAIENGYLLVDATGANAGKVTIAQINAKVPTWTGRTFDGWYTEATGGTKQATDITNITEKKTLYAHWNMVVDPLTNAPVAANDLTYNGMAQTLVAEPTKPAGCKKIQYSLDGTNWTDDLPKAVDAGTYTVKVRYVGEAAHADVMGADVQVTIKPKPLTANMLSGKGTSLIFSGQPQGPTVAVKDGTTTLGEGTAIEPKDYVLTNTEATTAGSYAVKVTGTGNYTGTVQLPFTIAPYEIGDDDKVVIGGVGNFTYNGQDRRPSAVTVKLVKANGSEATLREGADFEIEYPAESVNAGNYEIKVKLKNNYKGEATKGYKIVPKPLTANDVAATPTQFIYSGQAQGPAIAVTSELESGSTRTTLVKDTDYKVTGEVAKGQGTYTATITGTGNYMGKVTKSYTISPYVVKDTDELLVSFGAGEGAYTYNGAGQYPQNVTVSLNATQLTKDTDYTISYCDKDGNAIADLTTGSVNVGAYQVKVELTGNYSGTTAKGYVINPKPIEATDVQFNGPEGFQYTYATQENGDAQPQGPSAEVKSVLAAGAAPTLLYKDTDYTVADAPNYDAGTYTMVVKGKGNFCGEVTQEYTIKKATIDPTKPEQFTDANKPTVNKTDGKNGLVYNADEQLLVTGPTTMPQGYLEVLYSIDGGTTWTTDPKGTNVGDYTVQVKYVGDKNHKDFTIDPLTAKIVKRSVTITGESATKTYNGTVQKLENFSVDVAGDPSGTEGLAKSEHHVTNLSYLALGTAKGEYDGAFTPTAATAVKIVDGTGTDVSANYEVTLTVGKLTITAAAVTDDDTIDDKGTGTSGDNTVVEVEGRQGENAPTYDAQPHKPVVVDKQATDENGNPKTLEEGTDYDVKYYAPGDINPDGSVKENAQELTLEEAGEKVAIVTLTGDYSGTIKVRVDVKQRPVTFTGETAERTYTGKVQEIDGVIVGGDGLVSGHTHNVTYSAKGTKADEYNGAFSYGDGSAAVIKAGNEDVTKNYAITIASPVGKLTITATNVDGNNDGTADNLTDDNGNTVTDDNDKPVHVVDLLGTDGTNAPVYDDQDHKPTVVDNSCVDPATGKPKVLVENTDYTVAYYEANPDGTPDMSKPIDNTNGDAPKVAGDKVAVVTFTGDYSGSLNVPVDVQKRPVTFVGKTVVAHFDTTAHSVAETIEGVVGGSVPFATIDPDDTTATNEIRKMTYVVRGQGSEPGLVDGHTTKNGGTDTVVYDIKDVVQPDAAHNVAGYPINAGEYPCAYTGDIHIYRTNGTDVTTNYAITKTTGTYTILQSELHNNGEGYGVIPPDNTDDSKVIHVEGKTLAGTGDDAAEVYDGTPKKPTVTAKNNDSWIELEEGTDYDVAYYAPNDVTFVRDDQLSTESSPMVTKPLVKEGARQMTAEEAGEKIAVVTLKGNMAGTITAHMDVKQRPVTFTGNSDTKAYNGQKQTVEGYEASTGENEGLLTGEEFGHTTKLNNVDSIVAIAEGTAASATPYAGTITAPGDVKIWNKDGADVTKNYAITTTAGALTITKTKVTDGGNGSGVKAGDDGNPVDSEGTPTDDPTKYVKVVDVRGKDGNDAPYYDGTPKVPEVYDEQNKDGDGNPKKLEEGKDYDVVYYKADDIDPSTGKPKDGAESTNPTDAGDKVAVVTLKGDYEGTVNVPMDVKPRPITFTGDQKSFSYDGKQHVVDTLTVADQGLVEGHTYGIRYRAEGTDKGDYAGAFVWPNRDASSVVYDSNNMNPDTTSGFVFDALGKDVTANYAISFKLGNLKIGATKIQDNGNGEGVEVDDKGDPVIGKDGKPAVRVNVTVGYDNENPPVYDGKDHAPTVHDVQGNKDLTEDTDYTVTYYNKDEIDGEGNPKPDATPTTAANAGEKVAIVEFIDDYTGTVKVDTKVLKRPVTFTGNSGEKSYNGAKQTVEGCTSSTGANEGLLTGEEFGHTTTPATAGATDTVSAKAEGVNVGSYTGTITAPADVKIYDKTGKEQTSNYEIQTEPGTLTIKPAKIGDGGNSKGYVTDNFGNPVDDEGNLAKSEDGKPVRDAEGNPVGQDGKPIKPAIDITSKGGDDTPTYDGSPKDPVVVDNKATDQSGEPQPKTLEKGTDYDVEYFEPKRDDEGNYVDDDGKPTDTPVPDRDKPTDPADAGEKIAVITLKGDYDGTINKPITIAPAPLAIRTGSATKPYDGTPLTNKEVTIDGLAKGETVEVEVTGSQTEIGSSKNTFTTRFAGETEAVAAESAEAAPKDDVLTAQSSLFVGQSEETPLFQGLDAMPRTSAVVAEAAEPTAKRSNYDLAPAAETEGTLTVISEDVTGNVGKPDEGKRIEVTPIPTKGSKPNGNDTSTYTGKPVDSPVLYDTNKTDENGEPKKLEEGTDYDVTYYETNPDGTPNLNKPLSGKPTDAGTYAMVVTFKGAYTGSHTMPITINKAKLTVTTPSAKKTYDGKALTTGKKGATIKGFVNGETAPFEVTGTQTQVGSSKNTYTISWDDSEATAKKSNYTVTEKLGTLTVSAAKSSTSTSASTKASTPKTGDPTLAALPLAMGAAFTTLIGFRRRRRTK